MGTLMIFINSNSLLVSSFSTMFRLSRNIVENDDTRRLLELIKIMRVHENQQTAPIVATIALLVGNKVRDNVSKDVGLLISDIIRWDVTLIKQRTDWPKRKKFSSTMIYESIEENFFLFGQSVLCLINVTSPM